MQKNVKIIIQYESSQEEVDANYNMDMWVKQCDDGIVSCFEAKVAFYDLDGDLDDDNLDDPDDHPEG